MSKITCATCMNEDGGLCSVKRYNRVAVNKRRNCDKYVLDTSKVKEKHVLKTTRLSYAEKEALRKYYKDQLKQYKKQMKQQKLVSSDPKHPLTGDLSRFRSTAKEDDNG